MSYMNIHIFDKKGTLPCMKFIISVVDGRPERVVARRSERSGRIDSGRPVYYITIHMAAGSHVRTSIKGSEKLHRG